MSNLEFLTILSTNWAAELARRNFKDFIGYIKPDYFFNWHHEYVAKVLQNFIDGKIKKLMIFMPPQHGKSELGSRLLAPFMLGKNPDLRIVSVAYAHELSMRLNREVQRRMTDGKYNEVFPETRLNSRRVSTDAKGKYLRNSKMFEIVDKKGSYISVGIGGSLAGNPVDVLIIDDPVKNAVEACSPKTQQKNYDWYTTVAETRLHNDSQVLLMTTRWDEKDLAGMLLESEREDWVVISLPAIKEDNDNPNDPRQIGEALWESKHSLKKLLKNKLKSPKFFASLYQQTPKAPTELLIFGKAIAISEMPNQYERIIGLDFGFSNSQAAACLVEIDRRNKRIYAKELLYELGLTNKEIAQRIGFLKLRTYCDGAEPKSVKELEVEGMQAVGVKKFPNSVLTMILFLDDWEIYICGENFKKERDAYQWQIGVDGKPINEEVDKHNHLFKALMYAMYEHENKFGRPIKTSVTKKKEIR